jgi:hypothetical protein
MGLYVCQIGFGGLPWAYIADQLNAAFNCDARQKTLRELLELVTPGPQLFG